MTKRIAIRILMMSPIYFRLGIKERKQLIQEFVRLNGSVLDIKELN